MPANVKPIQTLVEKRETNIWHMLLVFLVAMFPVVLVWWRYSLDTPFFALSADDLQRTLHAWEVTQGQIIPSDLWPPLQFWLEAVVLTIYPNLLVAPLVVNVTASMGALISLLLLGYTLGLRNSALFIQFLLIVSLPWYLWLSLSGLAEPIFFFCITLAYLGIAQWLIRDRQWGVWIAAISLLAAGMIRFDSWGYSAVFSVALCWYWWRAPRPQPHTWLIAAGVPWIFPAFWMGYHYTKYGDPFYFSAIVRDYILSTQEIAPLTSRLLLQPQDLWAVAGVTLPIGLIGLWFLRHKKSVILLTLMALGAFAMLMISTLTHATASHNTARLIVIYALFLTPCAAFALHRLGVHNRLYASVVVGLLLVIGVPRLMQVPNYPNGISNDTAEVSKHIAMLRATDQIQSDNYIMVEVVFWDYILLRTLTNTPDSIIFDREPDLVVTPDRRYTLDDVANPSLLHTPAPQLYDQLKQQDVHVVVAYSETAVSHLESIAQKTFQNGRFSVFLVE